MKKILIATLITISVVNPYKLTAIVNNQEQSASNEIADEIVDLDNDKQKMASLEANKEIRPTSRKKAKYPNEESIKTYALGPEELIVRTFNDLKLGLEDGGNGKTVFHLGADILMETGINVSSAKGNVIIDGINPDTGEEHTLITTSGMLEADVIEIASPQASKITVQRMNLIGRSLFGIVSVKSQIAGVEVAFLDVTYGGQRLANNPNGTIRISDSIIRSSTETKEEMAKGRNLILEGSVTLQHLVDKTAFSFTGENPTIDIKENAIVQIIAKESFNEGTVIPRYTQEKGSKVKMTRTSNIDKTFLLTEGDFKMEPQSELRIVQSVESQGTFIQNSVPNARLMMDNAKIIIENSALKSGVYLSLGQIIMNKSEINIVVKNTVSAAIITTSSHMELTDSKLNITVEQNVTTEAGLILVPGKLTLERSEIKTIVYKKVVNQVLKFGRVGLINSKISVLVREGMSSPLNNAAVIMSSPEFILSEIIVEMGGESGILYRITGNLLITDASTVSLKTEKSRKELLHVERQLIVSNSGTLIVDTNESATAEQLIKVNYDLEFSENAIVHLINRKGLNKGLISMGNDNYNVVITNPKQVIFFAPTLETKLIYGKKDTLLEFSAEQINQWKEATTFEQTGTLVTTPDYEYKKKNGSNMSITAHNLGSDVGLMRIVRTNYRTGDGDSPTLNFSIHSDRTKVLSLGRLDNSVVLPKHGALAITGVTDPGANISYHYYSEDVLSTSLGTAGPIGNYRLPIKRLDEKKGELRTNIPYLYDTREITPERLVGELKLLEVPKTMKFGQQLVPTKKAEVVRADEIWAMKIEDTRNTQSNWKLFVTKKTDLIPSDNSKPSIINPFTFVDDNGEKHILGEEALAIKTVINGQTISTISWPATEGLLLTINPGNVYSNVTYKGIIQWSVQDTP
ncbi:MAG: hypothetical protein ACRC6X_04735 [Culicoidibacterales bacterium]